MFVLGKNSLKNLDGCHKDLQIIAKEAIKDSPYDYGISHGYRSPEEQHDLYQKGRSKPGHIITYKDGYTMPSKHNMNPAEAFDIYAYIQGKANYDKKVLLEIGLHIMEIAEELYEAGKVGSQLTWGGYWKKFQDMPHYQI